MRFLASSNKRMALLFAILLAVFSTGMVIAHQCHANSSSQVVMQHNQADHGSATTVLTVPQSVSSNTERLIDIGCVALFIVVLLFGRKFVDLSPPNFTLNRFLTFSRYLVTVCRPQVFHLALFGRQLGVIRI